MGDSSPEGAVEDSILAGEVGHSHEGAELVGHNCTELGSILLWKTILLLVIIILYMYCTNLR